MAFFIGNPNFQMLTPDQTNPFQSGLTKALAQHLSMQNVRKNRKMMPFIAPQAQANLQGKQLSNQKTDLANKLAQMQLPYGVENLLSQIGLRNSQSAQAMENAQGQQITNKYLPQQSQANIEQTKAMSNYYNMGGPGMGVQVKDQIALKKQLKQDHKDWTPDQINDAAGQYLKGKPTFSNGDVLPELSGLAQGDVDNITRQNNTAGSLDRQQFARMLKSNFDQADKVFPLAKQFAGLPGDVKLQLKKVEAQGGQVDPRLDAYNKYTNTLVPAIATEIIRMSGAHSTDGQKAIAIRQANTIASSQNSILADSGYKFLKETYRNLGKVVASSITQNKADLLNDTGSSQEDTSASSAPSTPSTTTYSAGDEAKIKATQDKHGLTREQAIDVLKNTGLLT